MSKKLGMYQEVKGDLFNNLDSDCLICHVCNNLGGWGAGFVLPLAKRYPSTREYYLKQHSEIGLVGGTNQYIYVDKNSEIYVANMIAQTLGGKRPLRYNWLSNCMDKVANFCIENNLSIICPKFGSDLAGGDWNIIKELIMDCWLNENINVKVCYL